jgi:hypothetical protein
LPRLFENCFELSVLYGDEKIAGGIHIIADCQLPIDDWSVPSVEL